MGLFRRRRRFDEPVTKPRRTLKKWISDQSALAVALFLSIGASGVDLAAQISYYLSLPLELRLPIVDYTLDLAYPIAAVVVGSAWTFGVYAAYCSARGLPAAKQITRMWVLSLIAAIINFFHGWALAEDVMSGLVLGGVSILSPLAWHSYVTLSREQRAGLNLAELREIALQRLMHPIIYTRAASLRTLNPEWGAARAWEMASVGARLDAEHDYREDLEAPRGSRRKKKGTDNGRPSDPTPTPTRSDREEPSRPDDDRSVPSAESSAVPTPDPAARPDAPDSRPVPITSARQSFDELVKALEEHANTAGLADGQRITEDWVQQASREVRGSGMKATRARAVRDELNARRAA